MAKKKLSVDPIVAKRSTTEVVPMKLGAYRGSKSTQNFFNSLKEDKNINVPALQKVWRDNGAPDIRTFDRHNPSITDRVFGKNPHYNPLSNTISIDTGGYTKEDYSESFLTSKQKQLLADYATKAEADSRPRYMKARLMTELPHAKQFSSNPLNATFKFTTKDVPAYIKGDSPYNIPGTLEYEAHKKLESDIENTYKMEKKKGTLIERPKSQGVFLKKKMAQGGWAKANGWMDKNVDGIATGAQLGAIAINAFAPQDEYGVTSNGAALGSGALSGAAVGAKLGSSIPIVGSLAGGLLGAGIGAVSGLLGNKSANRNKQNAILQKSTAQLQATEQAAQARVAADPTLKYGKMQASYYRFGGTMMGTGPTPPRIVPSISAVQAKPRLMPNIATMPTRQKSRYASGGNLDPLSTQDIKVEGPSHENGGVPIPALGAELEGGETINNGFVFSKKLGFAKPAEKIARATGRAEARPDNDINRATVGALQRKTNILKVQQEAAKEAAGIPNDFPTMENGGDTLRVADPGHPRLMAYNDSLKLFTKGKKLRATAEELSKSSVTAIPTKDRKLYFKNITTDFKSENYPGSIKPSRIVREKGSDGAGFPQYKKPTQPVVYEKPVQTSMPPTAESEPIEYISPTSIKIDKNLNTISRQRPDGTLMDGSFPNLIPMSDKAKGVGSIYNPARDQQQGKSIPTIKPSGRTYKFGGKLMKMEDGGRGILSKKFNKYNSDSLDKQMYPNLLDTANIRSTVPGRLPLIDNVMPTPDPAVASPTSLKPVNLTIPSVGTTAEKPGLGSKILSGVEKAAPFLSNFVNATQRLPLPPLPTLNDEITPNLVDYSASRAEAVRSNRGATEAARKNLNSGAAVSATAAANLSQQVRSVGQINEAENNANATIRNQTAGANAGIKAANNTLKNNYQNELVQRELKGQQLRSENFANIEQKIQGMARDKKLFNLEDQKIMLGFLGSNDSGAGYEAARDIFSKHLSKESLASLDKEVAKMRKNRSEERADNMKLNKLQLDYLKRKDGATPGTVAELVGKGVSIINTSKEDNAADKTKRK